MSLQFSKHSQNAFNAAPFVEWRSHNGDLAGQSKSSKGLSYVQVYHAGRTDQNSNDLLNISIH